MKTVRTAGDGGERRVGKGREREKIEKLGYGKELPLKDTSLDTHHLPALPANPLCPGTVGPTVTQSEQRGLKVKKGSL